MNWFHRMNSAFELNSTFLTHLCCRSVAALLPCKQKIALGMIILIVRWLIIGSEDLCLSYSVILRRYSKKLKLHIPIYRKCQHSYTYVWSEYINCKPKSIRLERVHSNIIVVRLKYHFAFRQLVNAVLLIAKDAHTHTQTNSYNYI